MHTPSDFASPAFTQNAAVDNAEVQSDVAALLDRCPTLPSLPSTYLRLVEAMNDPYSAGGDFARIIEEDASLTMRVLKLVNSSMYAVSPKVESVSRALVILGIEPLHDLVLATSVVSSFNKLPSDLIDLESFWKHSLGTAVVSRLIGEQQEKHSVEALFVCGLLHDIGRLIMCLGDPERARKVQSRVRDSGELLYHVEREEFGFDHSVVGGALMRQWHLPPSLSEPVLHHHQPDAAGAFERPAAIVHIADIISHALMFGSSGERLVPELSTKAWSAVDGDSWFHVRLLTDVEHQFLTASHGVLS